LLSAYLALLDNEEDRDKLSLIYRSYYSLMIAVAMRYLHNIETAKDIVHQAILRVIDHLDQIDVSNSFKTENYLCIIVKHLAIDEVRTLNRHPTGNLDDVALEMEDPAPAAEEIVISQDGYEYLVQCINSMSDTYKAILYLKYINGLKEWEIAELLDLSAKTVNVRIFRGRQILQKKIKESGFYEK